MCYFNLGALSEEGYQRLRDGELAAGLPDIWAVRIDPTNAGEQFPARRHGK